MKSCYRCKCSKNEAEFSAHRGMPDGLQRACKSCVSEINRDNYARNRTKRQEAARIRMAKWRSRPGNAEKNRQNALKWYRDEKNNEVAKARSLHWKEANPEWKKRNDKAWREANPGKARANEKRYKVRKRSAMPAWANEFFIAEAYDLANKRTKVTGFAWHVDHIVPLQGKTVCGLHVEHNLRVIPAVVNLKKGNRRWPDMPAESPTRPSGHTNQAAFERLFQF